MSKTKTKPKSKVGEESATSNEFSEIEETKLKDGDKDKESEWQDETHAGAKLNKNFFTRVSTTLYMLFGYIFIISMGHFYVGLLILGLLFGIYKQITNLKRREDKQNLIPITPVLNWMIFGLALYHVLAKLAVNKLPLFVLKHDWLEAFFVYHNFVSFSALMAIFTLFVLSLKQGFMKYQFRLFGWNILSVMLIIGPGSAMLNNTFQGLCWFILPTLMVICNDIFAYLVGYFFGKTRLIELSPKKTWEGFIGGAVITFFFSMVLTSIIAEIPTLVCPQKDLTIIPFSHPSCKSFLLDTVVVDFKLFQVRPTYLMLYTLGLAVFASIIAPFGGFFASGLKRIVHVKDFADTIPGHGGITDRMDCQLMMGGFAYFYIHNILIEQGYLFSLFLQDFSPVQKVNLFNELFRSLKADGLLNATQMIN